MTSAILFPTKVVAMNFEGFLVMFAKAEDTSPGCLICNANRTLFEDTKAISIPEKKADSIKQPKMTNSSEVISDFGFYFQIFYDTHVGRKTFQKQQLPIYRRYKNADSYFECLQWPR